MSIINQRLNGINPLSYMGVNAPQPTNFIAQPRDPNSSDSRNIALGSWWLNTATQELFYLASLAGLLASWVMVSGASGAVVSLTGNSGGAVSPLAGNINVVGDGTTINIVGVPATHTLTASTTGVIALSYGTDFTSPATPAAGVLNIIGGASTDPEQVALVYRKNTHTAASTNNVLIKLNDSLSFPATNAAGTAGVIYSGGVAAANRLMHNFGTDNYFYGLGAGNLTLSTANSNIGIGSSSMAALTTGLANTCVGRLAGAAITTGTSNTAIGYLSMQVATTAVQNTMVGSGCGTAITTSSATANSGFGFFTFNALTTGSNNTAIGQGSLSSLITGTDNTVIGHLAGSNYTGAESSNICIGSNSNSAAGTSNTLTVGTGTGTGTGQLNRAFIHGIRGITTGVNDAVAVLIDSAGQLGTTSSSLRVKDNVNDMGSYSEDIMSLRPVTFNYKVHSPESKSVGLIAEEVDKIAPHLVVYDKDGLPQTIRYHDLVPMLLNELQKLAARVKQLESKKGK